MHLRRFLILATVVTTAAVLGTACGDSDTAGENIAEKIVEESSGEKVDIDVDGDDVKIESEDGSSSFSTSGDLPEDWPKELDLPDGATLAGSTAVDTEDGRQLTVNGTVDATPDEVFEHFEGQLDGWKQSAKSNIGTGDDQLVNASWEKDGETVTLTTTRAGDADETSFIVGVTTTS